MTAPAGDPGIQPGIGHECPQCGSAQLRQDLVRSAIWHGERLVVVDRIPAVVCDGCGERFYDDATATMLDLMHGDGFPPAEAVAHMHVPVFSFSARVPPDLAPAAEAQE